MNLPILFSNTSCDFQNSILLDASTSTEVVNRFRKPSINRFDLTHYLKSPLSNGLMDRFKPTNNFQFYLPADRTTKQRVIQNVANICRSSATFSSYGFSQSMVCVAPILIYSEVTDIAPAAKKPITVKTQHFNCIPIVLNPH